MVTYKVIFESYNGNYRIAGVSDNPTATKRISGSTSSKGTEYNTVIMDYVCSTPLNNDFYVVYTRNTDDVIGDNDTFYNMVLKEGETVPSENDIYLYKLEKSALNRVDKINESLSETTSKDESTIIEPVMVSMRMNKIYNVDI
jgi:hypothetical protein